MGESQWGSLPIVATALSTASELAATEVLPAYLLAQVGLDEQARVSAFGHAPLRSQSL